MSVGAAIISDKQLGDVLLLQPAARYLAQMTGRPTALFVKDAFHPMIELMPDCAWGPDLAGKEQEPFDVLWTTSWSSRAVLQAFRLRTKKRILLVNKKRHLRWWYRPLFHEIRMEPPTPEYWALYFWRCISTDGNTEGFAPPVLQTPPDEWRHAELPAGHFMVINPTAAWPHKYWPARHWQEFLAAHPLAKELPWVMTGGGSEAELAHCAEIAAGTQVPLINLAGKTSLKNYLHALSAARVVFSIDGAASHIAQAFGKPTVSIFGPTHETKWHWATERNRVLAARRFNGGKFAPAEGVPVDAVIAEATAIERVLER